MNIAKSRITKTATKFRIRCRAFTLIEILVVIVIIAILAALSVGVFRKATESAKTTKCVAKLRAMGVAFTLYQVEKGKYPKAASYSGGFTGQSWWFVDIFPYLSSGHTFDAINDGQDTPLRCPSVKTRSWPFIDYGVNGYILPYGVNDIPVPKINNPSQTFLAADANPWVIAGWGGNLAAELGCRHNGSANVVMFDGHVEKFTAKQLENQDLVKKLQGLSY